MRTLPLSRSPKSGRRESGNAVLISGPTGPGLGPFPQQLLVFRFWLKALTGSRIAGAAQRKGFAVRKSVPLSFIFLYLSHLVFVIANRE